MFIDKVTVFLKAGRGGDGCTSFKRGRYVSCGRPDGGNGGRGGDVYFEYDVHMATLLDLSCTPRLKAEDGQKGSSNNKFGKSGKDLILKIPVGTLVFKSGKFYADYSGTANERILVVKGGRGGRGNASFKTARYTAPRISEKGEPGEAAEVNLELLLIAEVGLVGFPNSGKSTLLSQISAAKPKIADYPFTTLIPNLGVVNYRGKSFVVADIPGIIEGAHKGRGLGFEFLRHIRRTNILVFIIDVSATDGKDPYLSYKVLNDELRKYSKYLVKKHIITVLNKIDLPNCREHIKKFMKHLKNKKIFKISAATGSGVNELIVEMIKMLKDPPVLKFEEEVENVFVKKYIYQPKFQVNFENGVFVVTGTKIEALTKMTKFSEDEALRRYQNIIKKIGLEVELERMGAKPGDTVKIGNFEFVFER
ncbi:MAG: GTPase ObgE [Endomicrobium sp.]|jgi:GTP-binding protein|nr:GTPase ObgE [Endomicrobium sp.]